jgi:hypothetical protein
MGRISRLPTPELCGSILVEEGAAVLPSFIHSWLGPSLIRPENVNQHVRNAQQPPSENTVLGVTSRVW